MIVLLRSLSLLVCLAAVLSTSLTMTQPALAQGDDSIEKARQHFREGVDFYDQREYDKARLAFLQAYALKPHPSVLLNLAQSELRSGHSADAASHFAQYLRENTDPNAPERQEAELGYAAASSKAGAVIVQVDVDDADVLVDGEKRATSPVPDPIYVAPGQHIIEARLGADSQSQTVRARPGQQEKVLLTLRAVTAPGAAVAPASDVPIDDSTDEPRSTDRSRPNFFKWWTQRPLAIVLSVVAVAGVGGGIAGAVYAGNEYDRANETKDLIKSAATEDVDRLDQAAEDALSSSMGTPAQRQAAAKVYLDAADDVSSPCDLSEATQQQIDSERVAGYRTGCSLFDDAKKTGDKNKKLAAASFALAGVAAVGTVVYYFVNTRESNRNSGEARRSFRAQVAPWAGPEIGGLMVVGEF